MKNIITITMLMVSTFLPSVSLAADVLCSISCDSSSGSLCNTEDYYKMFSWPLSCPDVRNDMMVFEIRDDMIALGFTRVTDSYPIMVFSKPSVCTSPRYPAGWVAFPDPTITAGSTQIKASHIITARTDINLMRADAGLAYCAWTDPTLTANSTKIRKVHLDELRACISQVYTTCSQAAPVFTDATISAGSTKIRKVHMDELRSATLNAP